ncbi:Hypothetical protein CINCED_3A010350 [Cinara cedri]|uniref:Reverse transcriptase domain n=1 Tax=Cinara cedri TaxID=506608 RepID=A0A5E4NDG0_9HEMI|nr:Hypothetical protein CINCED_3A010350 [Cinara cedri]
MLPPVLMLPREYDDAVFVVPPVSRRWSRRFTRQRSNSTSRRPSSSSFNPRARKTLTMADWSLPKPAVSIDFKNAFNSLRWNDILDAVVEWGYQNTCMQCSNRTSTIESPASPGRAMDVSITASVPQGSVVVRKTISKLESHANEAFSLIGGRILGLGFQIATEKTVGVLFTNKYKYTKLVVTILNSCGEGGEDQRLIITDHTKHERLKEAKKTTVIVRNALSFVLWRTDQAIFAEIRAWEWDPINEGAKESTVAQYLSLSHGIRGNNQHYNKHLTGGSVS